MDDSTTKPAIKNLDAKTQRDEEASDPGAGPVMGMEALETIRPEMIRPRLNMLYTELKKSKVKCGNAQGMHSGKNILMRIRMTSKTRSKAALPTSGWKVKAGLEQAIPPSGAGFVFRRRKSESGPGVGAPAISFAANVSMETGGESIAQ